MSKFYYSLFCLLILSCTQEIDEPESSEIGESTLIQNEIDNISFEPVDSPTLIVLGTIQDAGAPHMNCHKACCENLRKNLDHSNLVVSLGYVDPENQQKYLFEASPDMPEQLALLSNHENFSTNDLPDGVFLTHAHIGHYTGLMYFGKEANNATNIPVFAMPKMKTFLETNGPWSQLVEDENIRITPLKNNSVTAISNNLQVIPLIVPHRDEFSETVGFKIVGPNKTALFIPDIDKWEKWELDINSEISSVDYAFLDATFYSNEEIPNRKIEEIPHPLVSESMDRFKTLSDEDKSKVYFIHVNHTNPILDKSSNVKQLIENAGYHVAEINNTFEM